MKVFVVLCLLFLYLISICVPSTATCTGGCTQSQGYHKNHPETWANHNVELCGRSYLSWLHQNSIGHAYVILVKQSITANLNQLQGACTTQSISDAISAAFGLLDECDTDLHTSDPDADEYLELARQLMRYNEGITGPGHCSSSHIYQGEGEGGEGGEGGEEDDCGKRVSVHDYVVVGGGAAGCLMAERLSRDPRNKVLLLEAGPRVDDDDLIREVTLAGGLEGGFYNEYFWQYAQIAAEFIPNRLTLQYTTGRVLGGGSTINGLQFVRGTKDLYDLWLNCTGDSIWSTTNVLAAFKRIETFTGVSGTAGAHGASGRVDILETQTTAPQTTSTSMSEKLVTAYEQLTGLSRLSDYNDLSASAVVGPFLNWQLTAHSDGTRESSSTAHMTPDVLARPNFDLKLRATATRVTFDNQKRARSVLYLENGVEKSARARKRIILCAGVYSTTILQHSGIGNATHLSSIGVPVVYDNPNVGEHLVNHQVVIATFSKNASDTPSANPNDIYEGGAWLPSPNPMTPLFASEIVTPRRIQVIGINAGPFLILAMIDLQPQSEGFVRIRDTDPLRAAESSDRILAGPNGPLDHETVKNMLRFYVRDLHKEFQGTGVGPVVDTSYALINPPLSLFDDDGGMDDDDELTEYARTTVSGHAHHWQSTCIMGIDGDGKSVTSGKGKVHGVERLIIADDSILPKNHDGNTVAPAYLVAEVISGEILAGNV